MPFLAAAVSSWTARRTNANRAPDAHTDFVDVENPGASLSFEEYGEESELSEASEVGAARRTSGECAERVRSVCGACAEQRDRDY